MNLRVLTALVCVVALGWCAPPAGADYTPLATPASLTSAPSSISLLTTDGQSSNDAPSPVLGGGFHLAALPHSTASLPFVLDSDRFSPLVALYGESPVSAGREVKEFPPAPSSAALFLSAVLSAGAWRLGRSVRQIDLAAWPDWYHSESPARIRHIVLFDLDFNAAPPCSFEQPVGQRPLLYHVRREHTPPSVGQCSLLTTAPRGPPLLVLA